MKRFFLFLIICIFSAHNGFAQNIPHANTTGPYGVQVNTFNGNLHFQRTDLVIPNTGVQIDLNFAYNGFRDTVQYGYGKGFTFAYNMMYELDSTGVNYLVQRPDGRSDLFEFSNGNYHAPEGVFDTWEEYEAGKFVLTNKYGMQYYFDNSTHQKLTKISDSNGNEITISYSGAQPVEIEDQSGRRVQLNWSGGLLQNIQDNNFSETRFIQYTYDTEGHLLTVTDPEGGDMTYTYDGDLLTKIVNERGDFVDVLYDDAERVKELVSCMTTLKMQYNRDQNRTYAIEKNASGDRMITFVYDDDGNLQSKIGSCCGFNTQYNYDNDLNTNQLTDANGNDFTANHDQRGNALVTTDPNADNQSFAFGDLNRLSSYTDKNGNTTTFNYDAAGNLETINQPLNITLNFDYDDQGNITGLTDGNGNQTNMTYNANNDVTFIDYPEPGTQESFEYDGVGNMTRSIDGNSNSVYYDYDKLNRLQSVRDDLDNEVRFEYDLASNLTMEMDANNNVNEYDYDAHHRLEMVRTPAGETFYEYDESDNLTAIIDANGHRTTFEYDTRNLLIEETDPEGNKTHYSYDGNGNVTTKTDANGDLTTYRYDALNRLIEKSYKGNTDTYTYDANGNLTYCANNGIAMSFTYDALNRLTSKTVLNWSLTIEYEYDGAGNRTRMIDPSGETLYEYDQNNRLISITNPSDETTIFVYDPASRLIEQYQDNGTSTHYTYDAANRLLTLENRRNNGTTISSYSYEYDGNGNRTRITEHDGTVWEYTYDGDNRLTHVQKNGVPVQQFELDNVGNRLSLNQVDYTYDMADRIQSVENGPVYQFDNNGNLIQKTDAGQVTNYEYDGENRLVRVTKPDGTEVAFIYDPFGNRILKNIDNQPTRYLLDGDNVLMELNTANTVQARYTAGLALDSWISMERNNNSYFYHTDGLGSITSLTNENASIRNTYEYDAYGNVTDASVNIENPYTYTGREWEETIGLYYYRTRFYDAEVGRFLTKDTYLGELFNPKSQNKYNYVGNNPINFSDPEGRLAFLPIVNVLVRIGISLYSAYQIASDLYGTYQLISSVISGEYGLKECEAIYETFGDKLFNDEKDLFDKVVEGVKEGYKEGDFLEGFKKIKFKNEIYKYVLGEFFNFFDKDLQTRRQLKDLFEKCDELLNGEGSQEEEEAPSDPPGDNTGTSEGPICIEIIRSVDPNEIIAPTGYDIEKWVAKDAVLPYTILFENDPDFATAAAQRVVIEHRFDANLNRFSFRLGDFGFGDYYFEVPEDVSYYNTQIDLTDSLGVLLQVTAGLNAADSMAFWVFESRDPETGLAATLPADAGFLPVNDTLTHVGEGFVNFTIRPASHTATGDMIEAQASIIFDDNAAIETNVDFNTIDADAPESAIISDDESNGVHQLEWSGTDSIDGVLGSGLASYALYRSTNDGPFLPIADGLTETTYEYTGSPDSSYCFYVRAKDHVANREPLKLNCEPACMNVSIAEIVPATGGLANGAIELEVSDNDGNLTYEWSHDSGLNTNTAVNLAAGDYSVTVSDASGCVIISTFTIENLNSSSEPERTDLFLHRMYPVPTAAGLVIEFSAADRIVFLEVYDMRGRQVFRRTVEAVPRQINQLHLDASDYPAGNYLVRIRERDRQVSGVFVKQ